MNRASFTILVVGLLTVGIVPAAEPAPKRDYRAAMRQFVGKISTEAKKANPSFLVVPQGGVGLFTDKGRPANDYLKAIDGIGQEEIFYGFDNKDNRKTPKKETDHFLKLLAVARNAGKPVLSIDYASRKELVDDAYAKNAAAGFVPFVADRRGLDGVPKYPEKPVNENARRREGPEGRKELPVRHRRRQVRLEGKVPGCPGENEPRPAGDRPVHRRLDGAPPTT